MANPEYIEYHIELQAIIEILNESILSSKILIFDRDAIFEVIKKAVISSNEKPFLYESSNENNETYFENYFERAKNVDPKFIPDLFEFKREFYDLSRQIYIFKERTSTDTFVKLFALYLLVVQKNGWNVYEFLDFQLHDNFHGSKYHFYNFLLQIAKVEKDATIFTNIIPKLRNYIDTAISEIKYFIENDYEIEEIEESLIEVTTDEIKQNKGDEIQIYEWEKYIDERKGLQLKTKFAQEEIKTFFSFLYKEKSVGGRPFLSKKQVEIIFKDGLTIPLHPLKEKYKLNIDNSYPKKLIDTGIYKFYIAHSPSNKEKKELILFLGSFIEDYSNVFESQQALENQSKNIKNYTLTAKNKIAWSKYLPQDK